MNAKLVNMTIFDVYDGFGSYVNDLETSLKMDPETWDRYLADPEPFLIDMTGDFGHLPAEVDDDHAEKFIRYLVRKWLNRPTSLLGVCS